MSFTIDRTEAAKRLGVSTRTVDRHIQSGLLRTRRVGKKMFIEEDDVEALLNTDPTRREEDYIVIMNDEEDVSKMPTIISETTISPDVQMAITEFSRIYSDAQDIIAQKDNTIKELSYKLGKAETELSNSVNASEYRQTAFLLESAKNKNNEDTQNFLGKISDLEKEVKKRNSFIIGLTILFVLLVVAIVVLFMFNHLK